MSAQTWTWIGLSVLVWFIAACIVGWLVGQFTKVRDRQVPQEGQRTLDVDSSLDVK